jgi:hypothetical protein
MPSRGLDIPGEPGPRYLAAIRSPIHGMAHTLLKSSSGELGAIYYKKAVSGQSRLAASVNAACLIVTYLAANGGCRRCSPSLAGGTAAILAPHIEGRIGPCRIY